MIFKPWDCAQPDEWLPQSLRLCWGGDGGDGGSSGFGGDGGFGGATTGGGDWGSSGSFDASGFDSGFDGPSTFGAGGSEFGFGQGGGGGDWASFGPTSYGSFNAPNPSFADIAGPNPGVTTGGGDWGSAGAYSAAGTGGGLGGALFGADTYGGGGGGGGGFWGDTGGGDYGGGGGSYGGGGGQGAGSFGSFGSGTLGGSNAYAAAPSGPTGSAFADSYGGGSVAGPAGQASSGAPTTSEAQSESAGGGESEGETTSESETTSETAPLGAPAQTEADPEAEPAQQDSFASRFEAVAPAQQDTFASRFDAVTPDAEPSAFGPQSLDQQSAGEQGKAGQQQDSFDSRFGFDTSAPSPGIDAYISGDPGQTNFDYGPGQQTAAPNFDQVFADLGIQPGWNPAEQMAGRTGLAEPTDWAANPYQPSTDVSVGRDFNQAFQSFDTPTGMDLAGDMPAQESDLATQLGLENITANPTTIDNTLTALDDMPGMTPSLAQQLGINDLTVAPGLGAGHVFGVTGMNYAPLAHEQQQPLNVELVPADQMPAPPPPTPPDVQPPESRPAEEPESSRPAEQPPETRPAEQPPEARPAEQPPPQEAPPAPPSLVEMVPTPPSQTPPAQPPGLTTMLPPPTLTPPTQPPSVPPSETRPAETPAEPGQPDGHDAPEPNDTSQPPQDPNAPRPPENIPGQVTGARGTYTNDRMDNPRTNSNYRDSGRTDYPQGRPGITFRTARQAGVEPLFRTEDINVRDVDARLVENINRALRDMERTRGIPANSLVATSGWRPAHRGEAHEHGQDPRTSQESVYTRYNPNGRNIGPAAQPGHSNHGPGRALDFSSQGDSGRALAWLRAHAREYGLETLGGTFDIPHIQLRAGQGGQRPSEQEQAEQRALDAQNRQLAQDRGLIAPGRGNQQARPAAPPGGWRGIGGDAARDARLAAPPQPPAEIPAPARLPPQAPQETRPPADIPAPVPRGPNEFDIPVTPPVRNATVIANNILKQATAHLNVNSDTAALNAAGVVAARAMAAAGVPANLARSLMLKGAMDGAIANGYGPGGPRSTVMGFSIWGKVQSTITESVDAALQGYQPAKPGELRGPPAPSAPGKQGALPTGQQIADLSQSVGPQRQQPSLVMPGLEHLSPLTAPPAPPPTWGQPPAPPPAPQYRPGDPGMFNPFRGNEAALPGWQQAGFSPGSRPSDAPAATEEGGPTPPAPPPGVMDPNAVGPRGIPSTLGLPAQPDAFNKAREQVYGDQRASLLDFLQNFNPISTAEARGGRSQAGNLQAPRADPGTIQSRLSEARAPIVNELQTNQGLRNTLDLIVTGEVGSQGKAAVLGFLETAMNKVAAEASREGRTATGRDLLNYLNSRSYFPDTWGKIESGKVKGGALTDDLIGAIAAGSNTTKGSTGNSSATSPGSRFGGNPTNATIGREHYGVENYGHHAAWYNALGALDDMPAVGFMPPLPPPAPAELRGLAKGGHVDKDEPVMVGEEGPEVFVPDWSGTVVPHQPQPGKTRKTENIDRWPKLPAPNFPGRYGGVEREILRQTRAAQDPVPTLMDLVDSGRLPLNEANWRAMLNDPTLIALGRSRMEDNRKGIDPGAEQYGAFIPAPAPPADPPDPTSQMAQALGYGSIKRRPMQIGRQSYQQ